MFLPKHYYGKYLKAHPTFRNEKASSGYIPNHPNFMKDNKWLASQSLTNRFMHYVFFEKKSISSFLKQCLSLSKTRHVTVY